MANTVTPLRLSSVASRTNLRRGGPHFPLYLGANVKRVLVVVLSCLTTLSMLAGCGGGSGDGPKLANPNDPNLKALKPAQPGAGGAVSTPKVQ